MRLAEGLGAEALGVGDGGGAARALALRYRDRPGDHGGGEQDADPGEQRPEAAVAAALALGLTLAGGPALLEEGALELVQLRVVARRPVERRGEASAAVELGRVAPGVAPLAGGSDQVLVKPAALGVLGKPVAQARPLAKQRLVGDLGRPLVDGEQATLGQHGEGPGGALVAVELELVEGNAAADEALRLLVVGAGEAEQHRARPEPLGRSEALVGVLGKARYRAADAAA